MNNLGDCREILIGIDCSLFNIFVGMLIGSYLWGTLADAFGRKVTLMTAMLLNGVCGLISAMSPNFEFFLIFRLLSGIG